LGISAVIRPWLAESTLRFLPLRTIAESVRKEEPEIVRTAPWILALAIAVFVGGEPAAGPVGPEQEQMTDARAIMNHLVIANPPNAHAPSCEVTSEVSGHPDLGPMEIL
jgi:hypothetical protein